MTPEERLMRLEIQLSNLYKDAQDEMRGKWDDYFKAHQEKVGKLLTKIREAKDDEAKKAATKAYTEYMRDHVVTSKWFRGMEKELSHQYTEVNERALKIINGERPEFYAAGYNLSAEEINSVAISQNIGIRFNLCSAEAVDWLMERSVDFPDTVIMPPPERIKIPEDERWNAKLINSQMAQGIAQGESIPKIAARIANVTDSDLKASVRRARTMATGCQNAGRVQSMKVAESWGVQTKKEWVCTHDDRTRDTHSLLDGEKIGVDDIFWNGCRYPGDHLGPPEEIWSCRCTLVTAVEGFSSNLPKGSEDAVQIWLDGEELEQGGTPEPVQPAAPAASAPIDPWQRVRELRAAKPAADMTSDELKEVGRAFYETSEFLSGAVDQAVRDKWAEPYQLRDEAIREYNSALTNAERDAAYKKYADANLAIADSMDAVAAEKERVSKLIADARGEERGFASDKQKTDHLGRMTDTRKMVAEAYGRYPASWVQKSTDRSSLTVKKVDRGWYCDATGELMISGEGNKAKNTAVHEIGHRMERAVGLVDAERRYYQERTAGEPLKWLGSGYRRDEKTREDNFVKAYMGKDYGGDSFELVSMGCEAVIGFSGNVFLDRDEDMRDWITGILLTY